MKYYIYQITNLVNNKIYVGVHKTKNLDDGYMGSGKIIRSAIEKYGISNFSKVILEFFENAELMYAREKEIVTDEFLLREDTYNLRRGGYGGWDYLNDSSETHSIRSRLGYKNGLGRENLSENAKINYQKMKETGTGLYSEKMIKERKFHWQKIGRNAAATPEVQEKKKETFKEIGHQQGNKNSQFGTCWIYHELIGSRKIKRNLLVEYLDQGWYKGRKIT